MLAKRGIGHWHGAVPVGHLPLDGNAPEVNSHLENLKILARTLPKSKLLYVADTKLDAPDNLLAIAARKGARAARKTAVPFGPFLALGGIAAVFVGQPIVGWYAHHFIH